MAINPTRTGFPAWLWVAGAVALIAVAGLFFYTMSGGMNAAKTTAPATTTGTAVKTDPTGANRPIPKGTDPTGAKPAPTK